MTRSFLLLLSFVVFLLGCSASESEAPSVQPEATKNEVVDQNSQSTPPIVTNVLGQEWPREVLGFSEAESAEMFLRLALKADLSRYVSTKARWKQSFSVFARKEANMEIENHGRSKALRTVVDGEARLDWEPQGLYFNRPDQRPYQVRSCEMAIRYWEGVGSGLPDYLDKKNAVLLTVSENGSAYWQYPLLVEEAEGRWHFLRSGWNNLRVSIGDNQVWDLLSSLKPKNERERLALAYFALKIFNDEVFKWWELDCGWTPKDCVSQWRGAWAFSHFANNQETDRPKAYAMLCYHFGTPYLASDAAIHKDVIVPKAIAKHRQSNDGPWNFPNKEQAKRTWKFMKQSYSAAVLAELLKTEEDAD